MNSVTFEAVRFAYGDKTIFQDWSGAFSDGVTCLTGPSGGGKTTLLKLAAGLLEPDAGAIARNFKRPAFMFQEDRLLPWLSARGNVSAVLGRNNRDEAGRWLMRVGLGGQLDADVAEYSGGMRRRVALARALAWGGDILFLDEPFNGLDDKLAREMADLIGTLGVPVVAATHAPEPFAPLNPVTVAVGDKTAKKA